MNQIKSLQRAATHSNFSKSGQPQPIIHYFKSYILLYSALLLVQIKNGLAIGCKTLFSPHLGCTKQ